MRGFGIPPRAHAGEVRRIDSDSRVYLRAPVRSDCREFTELMRVSRAFHSPWATAPM